MAEFLGSHGYGDITFQPGSGGVFDVEVEGRLLFCKHDQGRFPTPEEILERLRA